MADISLENKNCCEENHDGCDCGKHGETVCIDASRVYDSCGDKDCLSDLRLYFTEANQGIINTAVNIRIRDVDVADVCINLEPVPFHRGFYTVDMTFFYEVCLDVFVNPGAMPTPVSGLAVFNKKVILYGSEGNVKTFTSTSKCGEENLSDVPCKNLPKATVQVAKPIALSAKIKENCGGCMPNCRVPSCICQHFGGEFMAPAGRAVYVTIGMFTVVHIERNVQILVPSYDFCIPEKECVSTSDNPCEVFSKIDFPTDEFFPPKVTDLNGDEGCGCRRM